MSDEQSDIAPPASQEVSDKTDSLARLDLVDQQAVIQALNACPSIVVDLKDPQQVLSIASMLRTLREAEATNDPKILEQIRDPQMQQLAQEMAKKEDPALAAAIEKQHEEDKARTAKEAQEALAALLTVPAVATLSGGMEKAVHAAAGMGNLLGGLSFASVHDIAPVSLASLPETAREHVAQRQAELLEQRQMQHILQKST